MSSLEEYVRGKLEKLETQSLKRQLVVTERGAQSRSLRGQSTDHVISFCCNDYLNLSQHPDVKQAACEATMRYGAGAGASRLITGNHPLYQTLESRLAALKGTEDAVVFGSGYLANIGIIPSLVRSPDLVFVDELAHACLYGGAQLSGAHVHVFQHNCTDHLEDLLRRHRATAENALIVTDGVFSMDGDFAPLGALVQLSTQYDAWLMSDDAHGLGVVGNGRGSSHALSQEGNIPLQMGTLSKAVGSYGGYVCCSHAVADLLRNRARSFVYTTGLPPGAVASSIAALNIIETQPELCAKPVENARLFASVIGLDVPHSPIVPLILGDADNTLNASDLLSREGFLVTAIRPPTVPEGTSRLRFTFTADHETRDINRLADLVRDKILPMRED